MPSDKATKVSKKQIAVESQPSWSFLSNHTLVIMCLVGDPLMRMRDIAYRVGITERAVQRILTELEAGGFITRHRDGRRNSYSIHLDHPIGHPMTGQRTVSELMNLRDAKAADASSESSTIKRAANGTSFGRRRGPVARPAGAEKDVKPKKRYVSTEQTSPKRATKTMAKKPGAKVGRPRKG
ncbi:MAG: helix-turn-helix transcriptional regulator [bacterium]